MSKDLVMTKKVGFLALFALLIISFSCEQPNPFGPRYDVEGNLAKDRERINEFLETAAIDSLYRIHDSNGVVIIVQEEGSGAFPRERSLVYTNYIGKLLDGTVFDTNLVDVAIANDIFDEERVYRIFQFGIDQGEAIPGFSMGFKRLRSGSKAVLIIPSPWAYQDRDDLERIPANSILMFEVDFLGMD